MQDNRKLFFLMAGLISAMALGQGCNETTMAENAPDADAATLTDLRPEALMSSTACLLDSDCVTGAFCFNGLCTVQCAKDSECDEGYACSPRNGRCVTKAFVDTMVLDESVEENAESPDLKRSKFALTDLNVQDMNEADASSVVKKIIGAEIVQPPPSEVHVAPGQAAVTIRLVTTRSYGPIHYVVRSLASGAVSKLLTAPPLPHPGLGTTTYAFDVVPAESSLGDQGKVEQIQIVSSFGTYDIALVPKSPVAGLYEGGVQTERFGTATLPIRMAVVTKPDNPKSFNEITGITLYMPSGQAELFSPEAVSSADATTWASVEMTKDSANNCRSNRECWAAAYSTNDYEMPGSTLVTKDKKINRSIRVELSDFDAEDMRFFGAIKDDISGFYRDYDTTTGQKHWATSSMPGTFDVKRLEAFDTAAESVKAHQIATSAVYRDLEDNAIIACKDADIAKLMTGLESEDENLASCKSIATVSDWIASEQKFECLSAVASGILGKDTLTSKIITQLVARKEDDTTTVAGFATLSDFLDNCLLKEGDPKKTVCIEQPEIQCAADLAAYSFLNAGTTADKERFMNQFHDLLRESYLGLQYAAWQQDIISREKWLNTADAPKFAAADIEKAVMGVLDDWEINTLQAHTHTMAKQFSQLPLEVLSNQTASSDEISAERYTVLADYQQTWHAVSGGISLAARRYNEILVKTTERVAKAAQIGSGIFDLYVAGLVESEINRNTNNTSLNGGYAASFYDNMNTLKKLGQSFDALVYMRDAEIAVSNSLNKDNTNVLARRAEKAAKTLDEVTAKRDSVFKNHRDQKISQQTTSANLTSSLEELVTEIVNICGLPEACKVNDVAKIMTKPECDPLTTPFYCGFSLNKDSLPGRLESTLSSESVTYSVKVNQNGEIQYTDASGNIITPDADAPIDVFDTQSNIGTGEAAEAILAYRKSQQHVEVARAELNALHNKVSIARETCEAYAQNISKWYNKRRQLLEDVNKNLKSIESAQDAKSKALIDKLDEQYKSLQNAYQSAAGKLDNWKAVQAAQYDDKKDYIDQMATYERAILGVSTTNDMIAKLFTNGISIADYVIKKTEAIGKANVAAASIYGGIITAKSWETVQYELFKATIAALNGAKNSLKQKRDLQDAKMAYEQKIADKEATVNAKKAEAEFTSKLNDFEKTAIKSDANTEKLKASIERLRETFALEDTHERDLQALENQRAEYLMLAQDMLAKSAAVTEAQIEAHTAFLHYLTLVQRANMLKSQYDAGSERLAKINNLYTAPAVIFSYASDLEAVENRIELAKERIYDYLAALEYNAVRPFVELRRSVYLARSTNDLKAILDKLEDVVDSCGGVTNTVDDDHAIIVSMREMLGITSDFKKMTMQQRFHYVLSNGNVPIKTLTRYTVDATGSQLLNSGHKLKSGTFALTIPAFANLEATCNAKIAGFAFKLVGENLIRDNAGTQVHPTITMFYSGKATLASCQPDIKNIASTLGNVTAYGTYTTFDVEQSKISPNIGINEWGNNDASLADYPLASTYTVLIDPEIGENSKINWDNVEDIQIKVLYTYENVRSTNSCNF